MSIRRGSGDRVQSGAGRCTKQSDEAWEQGRVIKRSSSRVTRVIIDS